MQNINKKILTNIAKNDILKKTNVFVPRIYGYKKRDEAHRKRQDWLFSLWTCPNG